jgi:hypothetical protein
MRSNFENRDEYKCVSGNSGCFSSTSNRRLIKVIHDVVLNISLETTNSIHCLKTSQSRWTGIQTNFENRDEYKCVSGNLGCFSSTSNRRMIKVIHDVVLNISLATTNSIHCLKTSQSRWTGIQTF